MHDDEIRNSFPVGVVPKNYSVMRDAVGSVVLNFAEGSAITFILSLLYCSIPFVKPLKIALIAITFIIVTTFEFKGCHDYTLVIAYVHYLKWKKTAKKYELGTASTLREKKHIDVNVAKTFIDKLKSVDWKALVKDYEIKLKTKEDVGSSDTDK